MVSRYNATHSPHISAQPLTSPQERIKSHAKAFDSLLALTPAREYYGSQIDDGLDPSEQWNRKKQSKEQKRAAKKAKLDPANQKSALDVMKEREKKRKRELGMDEEENGDAEEDDEGGDSKRLKKQEEDDADPEAKKKAIADKRREKRQQKKEKLQAKKAKFEAKKAAKKNQVTNGAPTENEGEQHTAESEPEGDDESDDEEQVVANGGSADMNALDLSGITEPENDATAKGDAAAEMSSAPTSPVVNSPPFDVATNQSEASSSSSISPPSGLPNGKEETAATSSQKQAPKSTKSAGGNNVKQPPNQITLPSFDPATVSKEMPSGTSSPKVTLPDVDTAQLQERLRKRIEELRAKRKADGPEGKPAKSRQELLEQRRKKEEQRKAHKKELRQQAKEEEARKREECLRGSGSPAADIFSGRNSPRPQQENSFAFSRLAFEDGTAADATLSTLNDPKKRKGPQDPKTALLAAEKKQARLAGLDPVKKADIAEKDMWLNAKKRAHGERVRDDTSLLKKALKRKEKQKGKSEKEWKERNEAVVKGKEMKQKKRETNLQKRREEKGQKGKKKGKPPGGGGKKKARPGFEGRFKA
jgi:hypothetical protein